ncbi:MAG: 2OG-Fe(II) oxygenase [Xanthomonadales bacterium]|nr:2OG-Fe(II) oxygenase [Xanthomonadales bacterium]
MAVGDARPEIPGNGDAQVLALARRLLVEHDPGSDHHARGLALLEQATTGASAAEACWLLGAYHLMSARDAQSPSRALHWLERAGTLGHPRALDRLADLCLQGLAVPADPARALDLHRALAARGLAGNAWQVGYLLDCGEIHGIARDPSAAAAAFALACALGHPAAFHSLGLRTARGLGLRRDPALGRALLLRAADAGWPGARPAADRLLTQADPQRVRHWYQSLLAAGQRAAPVLRRLADPVADPGHSEQLVVAAVAAFAAIGHPGLVLDHDGRLRAVGGDPGAEPLQSAAPRPWRWLCQRPRVASSEHFASQEECGHLMAAVAPWLAGARSFHGPASENDDAELEKFDGEGCPIGGINADAVVRTMERRIAALTGWSTRALEPCSIIRYRPGQAYRPHVDWFSAEQVQRNLVQRGDPSGQRMATFLVYLRAPGRGGGTAYPRAGLTVAGQDGMGLIHWNVDPDGHPDPESLHAGEPVQAGEKWLWRCTLRAAPVPPWQ